MHRTARKRLAGKLLRYPSGDAALTIARIPARIASGKSGQVAATAVLIRRVR